MNSKPKYKILLIEDEDAIRKALKLNLEEEFIVSNYKSVEEFLSNESNFWEEFPYDLVILDIMLPGRLNGLDFLKQIKSRWDKPVIIITARNRLDQKLEAFDLGADDYITKPFELEELIARVKSKLKIKKHHKIKIGDAIVDFHKQEIYKISTKEIIPLTNKEAGILYLLYENKGKPVSRADILEKLWPNEYPTNRTIDNFILRLRKVLEPDLSNPKYIITKHGKGYELSDEVRVYQESL
ncbi:MAG: response regulator transcription factor [Leptospiraceae bacterium]|nr:response regulator transcription factor [Leptospiraceae bacterium]MDW7975570.1 response regulator transcription factor [Leptospiraceae bacterium]